jgi:hypothetical protein
MNVLFFFIFDTSDGTLFLVVGSLRVSRSVWISERSWLGSGDHFLVCHICQIFLIIPHLFLSEWLLPAPSIAQLRSDRGGGRILVLVYRKSSCPPLLSVISDHLLEFGCIKMTVFHGLFKSWMEFSTIAGLTGPSDSGCVRPSIG